VAAVPLNYTVDGPEDAPVLVLGSSLGTDTRLWAPQVPALASRWRVVRYDHRGHGGSPVPPGPYHLADLGGDVLALLDHLGVARAHLGGLSIGGMVGMWVAAHQPDRIDRLALVCTSARLGPPRMWADRAAAVRADGLGAIADAVVARWTPPEFARQHPDVVADLRAMLVATPAEGYASTCAAIETMDLEPDLGRITAPTLVIAGLEDESTPPAHGQRIASLIPGARLALVAGAAHLANVSRPELVGDLLNDFLSGRAPRRTQPPDDTATPAPREIADE
jgi:3-oxoadipate enol-lactonase